MRRKVPVIFLRSRGGVSTGCSTTLALFSLPFDFDDSNEVYDKQLCLPDSDPVITPDGKTLVKHFLSSVFTKIKL
jgi:hypothetical protein